MLIGFGHRKGQGKTFAANVLKYKRDFVIVSFADPLYFLCEDLIGDHIKDRNAFKKQNLGPKWGNITGRDLLRNLGQGIRSRHKNAFCHAFEVEYKRLADGGLDVVCDDVRQRNEYQLIESLGGTLVKIDAGVETDNHPTETALEDYEWPQTLFNDMGPDFERRVLIWYDNYLKEH